MCKRWKGKRKRERDKREGKGTELKEKDKETIKEGEKKGRQGRMGTEKSDEIEGREKMFIEGKERTASV